MCRFESCQRHQCVSLVLTAARQSPKLLVGVRIPRGMPSLDGGVAGGDFFVKSPLILKQQPCVPLCLCTVRLSVRTLPFQGGKTSSILVPCTKQCTGGRAAQCSGLQIRKTVGSNPTRCSKHCPNSPIGMRRLSQKENRVSSNLTWGTKVYGSANRLATKTVLKTAEPEMALRVQLRPLPPYKEFLWKCNQ